MNYPLISEYIEAIKSAEDNFEELSYLRPVFGNDSLPVMTSGNFAVVFRFLEKELFLDSGQTSETEFPVLLMDWVDGIPMDKYIQMNINNQYALEMLAFRFSKLAKWMLTQSFAHGDLKPDNILIKRDGSIVLVDYDGMFVPAMDGQKARELGSPNYRHPLRTDNDFNGHIDDFPLADIALSLKAIALKPTLFKFGSSESGLLLNESDFRDLKASKSIQELITLLSDNELCCLFGLFLVVISQKELETITSNMFIIRKPNRKHLKSSNTEIVNEIHESESLDAYNQGCTFIKNKRYKEAYAIFRSISLDVYGQNGLGVCYAYGLSVEKDMDKAAYWFKNAAHKGLSLAQFNLGNCYFHGDGVKEDRKLAYYWYKKADDQGLSIAKEMLTYEGAGGLFKKIEDEQNVERWNRISSVYILKP